MIAVLVVEEQRVLASALEAVIDAQPDLECVGTAGTADAAVERIAAHVPDVVLIDLALPGTEGIEGTRQILASHPQVSVLVLAAGTTSARLAATAAGAAGFLAKDSTLADLLAAIRNLAAGKMVAEGETLRELLQDRQPGLPPRLRRDEAASEISQDLARLTRREREVLALLGEGLDPRAIAERLVVSLYTVRGHLKHVMTKLGAHTQLEAVVVAIRSGLLPSGAQRPDREPR